MRPAVAKVEFHFGELFPGSLVLRDLRLWRSLITYNLAT